MKEYHKIQTVFKRDPATNFKTLTDEFACPEFEYLAGCEWVWTEKVDGTNIRVMYSPNATPKVTFGGKTDNAQIPAFLVTRLQELFSAKLPLWEETFDCPVCLYGEGYGAKIQKGGGNYISDGVDFVLFDVKISGWWLQRRDVEDIADKLGIPVVPIIGYGPLRQAVEQAKFGIKSSWGDFIAEGYVMRPATELASRDGKRIIAKIKHKDFAQNRKEAQL